MSAVILLNHIFMGIFGMILFAAFCGIVWTRHKRIIPVCGMAALLLFQGVIYLFMGSHQAKCLYPVTMHLPRVYINLLFEGKPVVIEFMSFVCCAAFLVFVLYISAAEQERNRLEQEQDVLNIQISQAVREIEALRESQQKAKVYRHDLRHHMQYLSSCIENGRTRQAQSYIREICSEIEAHKTTVFCENEAANLILSCFAGRADRRGVSFEVRAALSRALPMSESDLCALLSNALENALNACIKRREKGLASFIKVTAYEENQKIFLQVINSCERDVAFSNGVPVTDNPGHGMGVRSICAIAERYNGIYAFEEEDGQFILRVSV